MKVKRLVIIGFIGFFSLLMSCSNELYQSFSRLSEVKDKICNQLNVKDVTIIVSNNNYISVNIGNSQYNSLSNTEKEMARTKIVSIIKQHYDNTPEITSLSIAFSKEIRILLIFSYKNELDKVFYTKTKAGEWLQK